MIEPTDTTERLRDIRDASALDDDRLADLVVSAIGEWSLEGFPRTEIYIRSIRALAKAGRTGGRAFRIMTAVARDMDGPLGATDEARLRPHTNIGDSTVLIPLLDEDTGRQTGKEAIIDLADGDLAAHKPWLWDGEAHEVYTVASVLGCDVRLYLPDLVLARTHGGQVVARTVVMPETGGAHDDNDDDGDGSPMSISGSM